MGSCSSCATVVKLNNNNWQSLYIIYYNFHTFTTELLAFVTFEEPPCTFLDE